MSMLQLIRFLLRLSKHGRHPRLLMAVVIVAGVISGLGNAALVAVINLAISPRGAEMSWLVYVFAGLCLVVAVGRFISQSSLAYMSSRAIYELRTRLCAQILATPLRKLEEIGLARMLAHLTDDVSAISEALVQIPVLLMNVAIVIGSLTYLGWLSWKLLLFICMSMVIGIIGYRMPVQKSTAYFRQARESWNELFVGFQGLTQGIKELKLHRGRRARFYETKLVSLADRIRGLSLRGYSVLVAANVWGHLLFFVALGLILFGVTRYTHLEGRVVAGYALVLLFIIGPLESILNMFPVMGRARVASQQLERLGEMLPAPQMLSPAPDDAAQQWREIKLHEVVHRFGVEGCGDQFVLGPISLELTPGELVFVVGGNGSGKTTLAKLIVGLYTPESGEISLDGDAVRSESMEDYRQLFSAIFSDFYLFDSLLGLEAPNLDKRARDYLHLLQLTHKVSVHDGAFSTVDLSQGQRKRLALLTAYLEDRPVYLFDEWGADQDPVFREVFYRQFLPALRERGKTAIVISHDDRYFDVADRLIELEYGRVRAVRGARREVWT
jgi:putative ATP-binding cassette transporter